ncbi:MAG: hypothetical protein Kow0059_17180 [Candidatus Sumerlaeia bacterium]
MPALCLAAVAGAWAADAALLLRQAVHEAGQGRLERAEGLYREAAEADPDLGWPALARFLHLSGQDQKLEAVLQMLAADGLNPELRARTLAAAGRTDEAISLLRGAEERGTTSTLILAGLLKQSGRLSEAGAVLWGRLKRLDSTSSQHESRLLFNALLETGVLSAADACSSLPLVAVRGLGVIGSDRRLAVEIFDPLLIEFQHRDAAYFEHRRIILDAGDLGPAQAWLAARLLVREESHGAALEYLQKREQQWRDDPLWPLLAEEMIEQSRTLQKSDSAERYLTLLKSRTSGRASGALLLTEAELAVSREDWPGALQLFASMNLKELPPELGRAARFQWMRAAVRSGSMDAVITAFEKTSAGVPMDDVDVLLKLIFEEWIETEQHWAIEIAARERLAQNPDASPTLWLLVAEAARQARLTPNQIDALYHYVQARPRDLDGLSRLAKVVRPVAEELASVEEKDIAAPKGERERLTLLAEQSLQALIRAQPYLPEHYRALIEFYKALGREEDARNVPALTADQSADAGLLGVGGYALALSGFPDEAMKYYDRALALEPDNMTVLMNRTACLTRLDRFKEADETYRKFLEQGFRGRAYHAHELVGRIWAIAQHLGTQDECLAYFESLPERIRGDWVDEALMTAANAAAAAGRLDDARRLIEKLEQTGASAETRINGWQNYTLALAEAGRLEEADSVLKNLLNQFGGSEKVDVPLMHARADLLKRKGDTQAAIATLLETAAKYPGSQEAQNGVFRAADLAGESGDTAKARHLYEQFLKSGSVSFALRHEAEAKLSALENQQPGPTPAPAGVRQ